ncbi:MAG: hypothetical protein ACRCXB_34650 [Aeromonadaceae bacterium]
MEITEIIELLDRNPDELKNQVLEIGMSLKRKGNNTGADQIAKSLFEIDAFVNSEAYAEYKEEYKMREIDYTSIKDEFDSNISMGQKNIEDVFAFYMWFKDNHISTTNSLMSNPNFKDNPEPIWKEIEEIKSNNKPKNIDTLKSLLGLMRQQIRSFYLWPCEDEPESIYSLLSGKAIKCGSYLDFYLKINEIERIESLINKLEQSIPIIINLQNKLKQFNYPIRSEDINQFAEKLKEKIDMSLCGARLG